jgi:hypothetical protein
VRHNLMANAAVGWSSSPDEVSRWLGHRWQFKDVMKLACIGADVARQAAPATAAEGRDRPALERLCRLSSGVQFRFFRELRAAIAHYLSAPGKT